MRLLPALALLSLLTPGATALNLLLAYSADCDDNRTDGELAVDLAVGEQRRRSLREIDVEEKLDNHYARLRTARLIAGPDLAVPREKRRKLAAAAAGQSFFFSGDGSPANRRQTAALSQASLVERRDRLLAVLSVVANSKTSNVAETTGDESSSSASSPQLEADFLESFGMDVLYDASADIRQVAERLPCLLAPPEPDKEKFPSSAFSLPNDLRIFGESEFKTAHQWGLLGPEAGESFGTRVTEAWQNYTGSTARDFVIGVVDTGCSMHPDLEHNMCTEGEDCAGYDFGDDDGNPHDEPLDNVHGTTVTSIIGATPNNAFGIAGICWGCRIMCLKVYNSQRKVIELSSILKSYNYLLARKVKLSNHSYISFGWSDAEYRALKQMQQQGHLLVVAAGNYACDLDGQLEDGRVGCYSGGQFLGMAAPASYDLDNILTVAAIEKSGQLSSFSGWGQESVDIAAPGTAITALLNTRQYGASVIGSLSGTSFACPHLTGVAALVWARNPNLSHLAVRNILLETGRSLDGLKELTVSGKLVDAAAAVAAVAEEGTKDEDLGWPAMAAPTVDRTNAFYEEGGGTATASEKNLNSAADGRASWPVTTAVLILLALLY